MKLGISNSECGKGQALKAYAALLLWMLGTVLLLPVAAVRWLAAVVWDLLACLGEMEARVHIARLRSVTEEGGSCE